MKWIGCACVGLVLFLAGPGWTQADEPKLTAKQILDKVDDLYRGKSSYARMTMKVVTEHWTREMKIEGWSKGKEKSLMRILSPRKEKGTATLKSGDNIWNYLPKVKRVIKVPSSMMGGSWMGSHFTNDDLIKESRMADDYDFKVSFEGKRKGLEVSEVTCIPKVDAAVVWGKVVVLVRTEDLQPLTVAYYDEDMELARTMTFSQFKTMSGRLLPSVMRMVPTDKPDEFTEFSYNEIEFDIELKDSKFSLRNLQR
ncbi:MAG: outer membrane lipoprotein-sorting protein [Deltaproteobacteria bacterium]|nr:outer membrane lipoprotein-sorting protein [Deltaproteobacteria bacterium]